MVALRDEHLVFKLAVRSSASGGREGGREREGKGEVGEREWEWEGDRRDGWRGRERGR